MIILAFTVFSFCSVKTVRFHNMLTDLLLLESIAHILVFMNITQ